MKNTAEMRQKIAVAFTKQGPAIYHSHHDLIRFWERAVKRAHLPIRLTQGFNPRPRIIFPHALALGIASRREEVELELYEPIPVDQVEVSLRQAVGDTLEIIEAVDLPPVKKTRLLTASTYTIGNWPKIASEHLPAFVAAILGQAEIIVQRGAPEKKRAVDIRPYLRSLSYTPHEDVLALELLHTTAGGGRPDEIARLAADAVGCEWRELRILKTGMTLE